MADKTVKCIFNGVNGANTGTVARTGKSKSFPTTGTLFQKNCPNATFYVDGADSGNSYYLLKDPQNYKLPNQKMYVYLDYSFVKMIWPDATNSKPSPPPPTKPPVKPVAPPKVTDETTIKYGSGFDSKITAGLKDIRGVENALNNSRVFGAPFHFINSTDYQPFKDIGLGRKYIENIVAEAPIVHFVPGVPSYLADFDKETQEAITQYMAGVTINGKSANSGLVKSISQIPGRYFNFVANYVSYMKYVNLLCRMCAGYMGIDRIKAPGTNTNYSKYDWRNWETLADIADPDLGKDAATADADANKGITARVANSVSEALFGDHKYLKVYVDPNMSFSESTSNSTTQSMFAGLFDQLEGLGKDLGFFLGGNTGTFMGEALNGVSDAVLGVVGGANNATLNKNGGTANLERLLGLTDHVVTGSNIVFPEIYSDSSYNKSYSITVNLSSPYGDPESIYLNVIVPMMHLIALGLPRQTSANSFVTPFLVKVFAKGWFSCEMGMVESISIEKGGSNGDGWSVYGVPTEVKVTLSIKDLYSNLMMPKSDQIGLYVHNSGLIEFLAVTCGVDITKPDIMTKITTIIDAFFQSFLQIPSEIVNQLQQWLRSKVEPYFKIGTM